MSTATSPPRETAPSGPPADEPPPTKRPRWHGSLLSFVLTFATTTLAGVGLAHGFSFSLVGLSEAPPYLVAGEVLRRVLAQPNLLLAGLAFSLPLMSILLVHEAGHYLTARAHRTEASLPFFIPAPFGLGTFGAVIGMRTTGRDRNALLDIGAAGPLAGFVVAFAVLLIGFSGSEVKSAQQLADLAAGGQLVVEGDSLVYALARYLVHGPLAAGSDVWINNTTWAGWLGLYLTWFNLQPFSQFDGGHVAAAVLGRRARWLSLAVFGFLLFMFALTFNFFWLVLSVLMAVMGRLIGYTHPPIDDTRPLRPRQRLLAALCLGLFVATLVPNPWHVDEGAISATGAGAQTVGSAGETP